MRTPIRPWPHRSWVFPRDPDFLIKAGRVLDLYQRRWNGRALSPRDFVLSADEKTQILIRSRRHAGTYLADSPLRRGHISVTIAGAHSRRGVRPQGRVDTVKKWFDDLDPAAAAKVAAAQVRLSQGEKLIVLFGGGTKRGQQRDIERAMELLAEYKARKKQGEEGRSRE